MESFGFLKYLRGGALAGAQRAAVPATTIAASAVSACEDDDASFFDLEFAVPDESAVSDADDERVEFNFAVAPAVAPGSEEVLAVDAVVEPGAAGGDSGNDKQRKDGVEDAAEATPPPTSATLLRPATKFRVLLLKLRKPPKVPVPADGNTGSGAPGKAAAVSRFLIKFRVDDAPLASLFTRDGSSDAGGERPPSAAAGEQPQDAAEEKRFAKEVVLKYLNKMRPLYVKVSRLRRFPGGGEETDADEPDAADKAYSPAVLPPVQQQEVVVACGVRAPRASVPAGLKQACKRLGKSRSASSAVAAAPATPGQQRRDDSLLQVQDGIQSAIAHCKRSFNASKGSESPLLRSMTTTSDPVSSRVDGGKADSRDGP